MAMDGVTDEADDLNPTSHHTVILGWSPKIPSLLRQLAVANQSLGGGEITVLAALVGEVRDFHLKLTMMQTRRHRWGFLLLCLIWLLCACALQGKGAHTLESSELPVLKVGEERRRESLAFFDGSSCEYEVLGLQNGKWYEIKISYPASIPASFDISFLQRRPQYRRKAGRRLLNIEKTVFYVDGINSQQDPGPLGHVLVEVHPAGVISKHHASDHALIIYNILCEEVFLGIPRQAWWVGFLAVFVICSAFYISGRLPETLVPTKLRVVKHPREAK